MKKRFYAAAVLALPLVAVAQGSGELWEITMSMPGMPAGMMPPQRVCQGDDPSRAATQDPSKKDCKVTDRKQSGTRTTVSMSCSDGSTMVIDQQFNAARTEFKSTMSLKSKKDGDMTMTQTGRKVGACDAVAENKARDAKMDAMKKQAEKQAAAGTAAVAAAQKQTTDNQIKQCSEALEKMDAQSFGVHGMCYKKTDKTCSQMTEMQKQYPEATKVCTTNLGEFCKRLQTPEGFMKTKDRENAAQMCGVTTASILAAGCPRVAKSQSPLSFLGAYCPVEAKPIAQEHCVGRDYTSKMGGKYGEFCMNYLANNSLEKPPASATDQVKQGVSKGLDKLKGLFGR